MTASTFERTLTTAAMEAVLADGALIAAMLAIAAARHAGGLAAVQLEALAPVSAKTEP